MKLIVSDLDGTLLNNESDVSEKTIQVIKKLVRETDIEFAIATGRGYTSTKRIKDKIGEKIYFICNNGSNVFDKDENLIATNFISKELSQEVCGTLIRNRIGYMGFKGKQVYIPAHEELQEELSEEYEIIRMDNSEPNLEKRHDVLYINEIDKIPELEKILIVEANKEKLFYARDLMKAKFGDQLEIVISSEDCLDLTAKNSSKKNGVEIIAKELGLDFEHIMAFGDSENDYKMLKAVARPVAMKGSYISTRGFSVTTYLTNDENGVADYIEREILSNEIISNLMLTKKEQIEESLRTTYRKKIWAKFVKAIKDFNLIEDGDKIAVGVSGGKDSLLLCKLFQELKKDKSKNFEVKFISMNPGFEAIDVDKFKENLIEMGIDCELFDADVWKIAFEEDPESPCFLCSKMRRGVLYKKVEELGFNKLALGHHFDDIVETTMINMFFAGTVKTMLPKVKSTTGKMTIIRPLAYIKEKDIINFMRHNTIQAMTCGCPIEAGKTDSKRKEIKILLEQLEEKSPNIKQSIFNSMKNINLEYVLGYTSGNKNK